MKTVVNSVIQCWAEVSTMMLSCAQFFGGYPMLI